MNLTQSYPRSVHDKFAGIVQIGRTVDKARAFSAGTLGEYHYNCGMDQAVFKFLGVTDHEAFAKTVSVLSDPQVEQWLRNTYTSKKTPAEIEQWNREWLGHGPEPNSDSYAYFVDLRNQLAPDRTDITTWPDLLDLDEHRDVPRKAAA